MCARPWAPAPPLSGHPSTHASSSRHLLCLGTDPLPPPGTHPSHAAATGERALLSEEAVKMRCGCRNLWERSPDASLQPPASPAARSFPVCPPHQLDREDTGAETAFRSSLSSGGGGSGSASQAAATRQTPAPPRARTAPALAGWRPRTRQAVRHGLLLTSPAVISPDAYSLKLEQPPPPPASHRARPVSFLSSAPRTPQEPAGNVLRALLHAHPLGASPVLGPTPGIRATKTNKVRCRSTIRLGWREAKDGGAGPALKGGRSPEEKRQVLLWEGAVSR